jgi:hypothetical protein
MCATKTSQNTSYSLRQQGPPLTPPNKTGNAGDRCSTKKRIIGTGIIMMKMQLPINVFTVYKNNKADCNQQVIDWESETIMIPSTLLEKFINIFNIKKCDSAFVTFYAATPFPIMNNDGPELSSLDDVIENSSSEYYTDLFLNIPNIKKLFGKQYFILTSGEGEYFFFYDSETDGVYDTDDFILTKPNQPIPAPKWATFYDFIESYYGKGVFN